MEIRSLNHRYLEFSVKSPPSLYSLEDRIRELCQTELKRGKVTVSISELESFGLEELVLDEKVLRFYVAAIRKMQKRFRLNGSFSVGELLTLPRIFSVEKKAEKPEKLWASLKPVLKTALDLLLKTRLREGGELSKDLLIRIGKIEKGLGLVEAQAKTAPQEYYEKLKERIDSLFGEKGIDEQRICQEAAILAERADVTEETVRLRSHLRYFREKLAKQEEAGKELDFLLQEMNRETNTLGAKAQDFGISKEVISMKAELEKIREQIQNIE